ncbi:hypothetical protein [Clavibacter michiganensis]|nr:hypothetical protein [Clavibacter michiganensis]
MLTEDLVRLLDREFPFAHDLEHDEVSRDANSVKDNRPGLLDQLSA